MLYRLHDPDASRVIVPVRPEIERWEPDGEHWSHFLAAELHKVDDPDVLDDARRVLERLFTDREAYLVAQLFARYRSTELLRAPVEPPVGLDHLEAAELVGEDVEPLDVVGGGLRFELASRPLESTEATAICCRRRR